MPVDPEGFDLPPLATPADVEAALTEAKAYTDERVAALAERVAALEPQPEPTPEPVPEPQPTPEPPALVADDFTDLAAWSTYHGAGQLAKQGARVRQNVEVLAGAVRIWTRPVTETISLGAVTLNPGDWAAGGIAHTLDAGKRTYGRWSMDLRMGASQGTRVAVLLWPTTMGWPEGGELDFLEAGGQRGDRQSMTVTNHWADATGTHRQQQQVVTDDFTGWHRFDVDWTPGLFVVSIDGAEVVRFAEHVPANPMNLRVQTALEAGGRGGPDVTEGFVDIARLRIYEVG